MAKKKVNDCDREHVEVKIVLTPKQIKRAAFFQMLRDMG
jgi:hypothetical protein